MVCCLVPQSHSQAKITKLNDAAFNVKIFSCLVDSGKDFIDILWPIRYRDEIVFIYNVLHCIRFSRWLRFCFVDCL